MTDRSEGEAKLGTDIDQELGMSELDVSVVIAFKDWGIDRLLAAVKHLHASIAPSRGEIIVSDYGSEAGPVLRETVENAGARYVYTPTDGVWSRSRALNAGFAAAKGRYLVSTDADMIFTPGAIARITEVAERNGGAVVLQCRDLPEGYGEEHFLAADEPDWSQLEHISRVRPRWGMGGMMAVPAATFDYVRGFDERMEIYGGEDIDFANRVRWAGLTLTWIEESGVRMYHMWHRPTRNEVSRSADGVEAVERNRQIMLNDKSVIRNVPHWKHARPQQAPLISVVISTRNRANHLAASIESVLAQTFQDFELIIMDDGSTDNTAEVVEKYVCEKVRYYARPHLGLAAQRNFAADISRGHYTAVHDDDDIMLPRRLEQAVLGLTHDAQGTTSGWINFDDTTGELEAFPGKGFSFASILYGGSVYAHATLLIETEIIRRMRYNENLSSGSDYNLGLRLARVGVRLNHAGGYSILRRLHARQVTAADSSAQKRSARDTVRVFQSHLTEEAIKELRHLNWLNNQAAPAADSREIAECAAYLPDHLCSRILVIDASRSTAELVADRATPIRIYDGSSEPSVISVIVDATWHELLEATRAGHLLDAVRIDQLEAGSSSAAVALGVALPAIQATAPGLHLVMRTVTVPPSKRRRSLRVKHTKSEGEASRVRRPRRTWRVEIQGSPSGSYVVTGYASAADAAMALAGAASTGGSASAWAVQPLASRVSPTQE